MAAAQFSVRYQDTLLPGTPRDEQRGECYRFSTSTQYMRSEWRLVIRQHVMVENAMRIGEMREMAGLIGGSGRIRRAGRLVFLRHCFLFAIALKPKARRGLLLCSGGPFII